jgi:hypothetical protein
VKGRADDIRRAVEGAVASLVSDGLVSFRKTGIAKQGILIKRPKTLKKSMAAKKWGSRSQAGGKQGSHGAAAIGAVKP